MKNMVRKALSMYGTFVAESAIVAKEQNSITQEQMERAMLAAARKQMIDNWLSMLNYDERFVVERHLIHELEWARVLHAFQKHWDGKFTRSNRQLCHYQANALQKISEYCSTYQEITQALFGDWLSEQNTSNDPPDAQQHQQNSMTGLEGW